MDLLVLLGKPLLGRFYSISCDTRILKKIFLTQTRIDFLQFGNKSGDETFFLKRVKVGLKVKGDCLEERFFTLTQGLYK